MSAPRFWFATVWVCIAIALRFYGSLGGDAAIVSGLLFLAWTIPFGLIWQFLLYDQALKVLPVQAAQLVGDALTMAVFVLFWFLLVPAIVKRSRGVK